MSPIADCVSRTAFLFFLLLPVPRTGVTEADDVAVSSIAELEQLPVGIRVVHEPGVAKAVKKLPIDGRRRDYTWVYRTEITAMEKDLTIVEFGAFHWDGTDWQ